MNVFMFLALWSHSARRMGGVKRYPSIAFYVMGFAGLSPSCLLDFRVARFVRSPDAAQRAALAAWCAADPGSIAPLALLQVPALRSSTRVLHRVRDTRGICSRRRAVICPTGSLVERVSSPISKNIFVPAHPKSLLELRPSRPARGAYRDRHGRWARDAVDAAAFCARWDRRAGREACERSTAR